jgi:hypothetical protein
VARDLDVSESGFSMTEYLLRASGQFYSAAYNWILALNTAYCYTIPQFIGGNARTTSTSDLVMRCPFQAKGSVVKISGIAQKASGLAAGTWISGGLTLGTTGAFSMSLAATPGAIETWVGTYKANAADEKSVQVFKQEMF